jgi:tRNA threonylcarbamoyladenosine biosynthesis protein TsaE
MEKEFTVTDINELPELAKQLLNFCGTTHVICFDAPMGAGKTTFIKALCSQLNYTGPFSSPTYPIINVYDHQPEIYHIDCYRLKSAEEAIQIGMEDYLDSGNYCFIEWAELIKSLLPLEIVNVTIENLSANSRKFVFKKSN